MLKNNRNATYTIIFILCVMILSIYFWNNLNKPYGNDRESIEKVIQSIEGYKTEIVEILEIKDINEKRIVSFLSNGDPAYIEFSRNKKGDYEWIHLQKSTGQTFATHVIHSTNNDSITSYFMIITSDGNTIAKMELNVNEQIIEQEFRLYERAVTWIELPKAESHTFKYKYYDKEDNLIAEY